MRTQEEQREAGGVQASILSGGSFLRGCFTRQRYTSPLRRRVPAACRLLPLLPAAGCLLPAASRLRPHARCLLPHACMPGGVRWAVCRSLGVQPEAQCCWRAVWASARVSLGKHEPP